MTVDIDAIIEAVPLNGVGPANRLGELFLPDGFYEGDVRKAELRLEIEPENLKQHLYLSLDINAKRLPARRGPLMVYATELVSARSAFRKIGTASRGNRIAVLTVDEHHAVDSFRRFQQSLMNLGLCLPWLNDPRVSPTSEDIERIPGQVAGRKVYFRMRSNRRRMKQPRAVIISRGRYEKAKRRAASEADNANAGVEDHAA